ncbi:NnrS family protein [Marinobacter nanhaiticus D15-8W]|uniref:NnrS family protein n=1 Tax=Marinobacter nanhaiticus D15-8W TaxID=626887 RepID=N6W7Z5_9GAMM|nr:NnrS family protein [Marinobacter nanhaiticus]ENO16389.1 NnrS family protein [Marinobacter nanhaiticus D15-8W]BES72750.1 NnrS family protein [Marinobacter nanhaiticus D15-8W]
MQTDSVAIDRPAIGQLFSYPFRIFFLSLALLGVFAVPLWIGVASGELRLPLAMPGLFWHQHEMLFGFLSAAIAGFLLTAVCVWTSTERTHGASLFGLWLVWLGGRLLLAGGAEVPAILVHAVNLAFMPLVMFDAGWRIWRARQRRQLMILVVLGLLWGMQLGFVLSFNPLFISGGLVMAMALSGIIGGRITPAFSSGWLRQQGLDGSAVKVFPRLDMLQLASMVALLALLLAGRHWGSGLAALVAAALMLSRLIGWKGWRVARNPLLWILHLSLLWIPVALVLLAGHQLLDWPGSAWAHAAGLGVIGSLVLGVIARVSLGHTGRALVLPTGMVAAFLAIQAAALVRVVTAFGGIEWALGVRISGGLWVLAFALFLVFYAGILARPRADGREG